MRRARVRSSGRRKRDFGRVGLICVSLLVMLSAGGYVGTTTLQRTPAAPPAHVAQTDDEVQTGSIVIMPRRGNACVQRMFDNRTGEMWDRGTMPCEAALARGRVPTPGPQSTIARVEGISQYIRGH